MTSPAPNGIDATATSIAVFEYVVGADGDVGVSQVAEELDVAKSVAYNHLSTLGEAGYVVKRGRKYGPTTRAARLGEEVRRGIDVYEWGQDYVGNLAEATDETVELCVMERDAAVPVAIVGSSGDWTPPHLIGERTPIHATAPGKAILASLAPDQLDRLLWDLPLASLTDRTITGPETLLEEVDNIRDSGVSFCREEQYSGVVGVGAPIDADESVHTAALAIVGPIERLHGRYFEEDLVGQVVSTANRIEVELTER
jgi:DNA-binding IclR family transcriptional regulator